MTHRSRLSDVRMCAAYALVLALAFSLLSCSIRLIAPYDETTDKQATQLRTEIDQFITNLISVGGDIKDDSARRKALDYTKSQKDYDKIGVDLRSLKVRAEAISQNSNTVNQVTYIINNLERLQARHKGYSNNETVDGKSIEMGNAYLRDARDIINEQFRSLLALEIAKQKITNADSKTLEK